MNGCYRSTCGPFFSGCGFCLTCPLSCNNPACKNCLSALNNSAFDGICGPDCLGFQTPLCACCENCPLCWYAACCKYCYVADLTVATTGKPEQWQDVVYPLVTWYTVSQILVFAGSLPIPLAFIIRTLGSIIENVVNISMMVMFGKAATNYARKQGIAYEAAGCCSSCGCNLDCSECNIACDLSLMCCLTYVFCGPCHMIQVGRVMEKDSVAMTSIKAGRPEDCDQCCDCWDVAGTGTAQP